MPLVPTMTAARSDTRTPLPLRFSKRNGTGTFASESSNPSSADPCSSVHQRMPKMRPSESKSTVQPLTPGKCKRTSVGRSATPSCKIPSSGVGKTRTQFGITAFVGCSLKFESSPKSLSSRIHVFYIPRRLGLIKVESGPPDLAFALRSCRNNLPKRFVMSRRRQMGGQPQIRAGIASEIIELKVVFFTIMVLIRRLSREVFVMTSCGGRSCS